MGLFFRLFSFSMSGHSKRYSNIRQRHIGETPYLYAGNKFNTPSGKGPLFATERRLSLEQPEKEFPFILSTVREVGHCSMRTMTGNCAALQVLPTPRAVCRCTASTWSAGASRIRNWSGCRRSAARGSAGLLCHHASHGTGKPCSCGEGVRPLKSSVLKSKLPEAGAPASKNNSAHETAPLPLEPRPDCPCRCPSIPSRRC